MNNKYQNDPDYVSTLYLRDRLVFVQNTAMFRNY